MLTRKSKIYIFVFIGVVFAALFLSLPLYAAVDARMIKARQMNKERAQQMMLEQMRQRQMVGTVRQQQNVSVPGMTQKLQYLDIKALSRNSTGEEAGTDKIKEAFNDSSLLWKEASAQQKEEIVWCFINDFRQNNVTINRPASHYVSMIDGMSGQNPELLEQSFSKILQFTAIIEYDFGNGQDKDALAKKVLGEEGFVRNKKRLASE